MRQEHRRWVSCVWIQINSVATDGSLHLSGPQCFHPEYGDNNTKFQGRREGPGRGYAEEFDFLRHCRATMMMRSELPVLD